MTKIESDKRLIAQSEEIIFQFLTNFNNFESLMPDKVTQWQSTQDNCYFSIAGIAHLGMRIVEKNNTHFIKIKDDGEVPFKFDFLIYLEAISSKETELKLVFDADLNMMMKAVAVKPLKDFLEKLLDKLQAMYV